MNCSASGQKTMIDLGGTTTLTRQLYDEITRCKDRIMGCSSHKEATPYLNRLQFLSNCLTRPARNVASSLYSMLNEYCKQGSGTKKLSLSFLTHPSASLYHAIHRIIFQHQFCVLFTHLYAVLHNFSAKWCSNGVPNRAIST